MMKLVPIHIDNRVVTGVEVRLPKTTLLAITTDLGYIMCGALDVQLLNDKLSERRIIAGRALGVRTLDELLNAPLQMVTKEAEQRGIYEGMIGREALLKMID